MKNKLFLIIFSLLFFQTCSQNNNLINTEGKTIRERFKPPVGFKRISGEKNSFAEYLQNLPLKPHHSKVKLYNGRTKLSLNVYEAVINLRIGEKNLHQCADAVMRLRAEYLWKQNEYSKIHFNFTNGFRVDYTEWMKGKRVKIEGNKTYWIDKTSPSNSYESFWKYMELIFTYAGTLSLSKELKGVAVEEIQIGDVFIQGGSPGHAVIVVDMAVNPATGEKLFMLAQSYMPAQEIQILRNNNNKKLSPWYPVKFGDILRTPEWTFYKGDLKRFN